jgi:protein FAM32A
MSFVGGKLKLKGGDSVKGGVKKKNKKSTGSEAALALTTAGSGDAGAAAGEGSTQAAKAGTPVKTKDGYILPAPTAAEDRRTEAQKRHDERARKLEEERLRKMATKGYRDRVKDFNEHLASLSEHHDIPKVRGCRAVVMVLFSLRATRGADPHRCGAVVAIAVAVSVCRGGRPYLWTARAPAECEGG